jgi:predicted Zn-dependent peptidase
LEAPRVTTLDSGVRIVTEHMDSVRSVALGFWIGTGSSNEDEPRAGLSHLIEHMLFRGTSKYGSLEIDQIFDAMGAELNAGTGKETTSVYARVLDIHLAEALDVVADMVWRPRFADDDLLNERQIVLEEIAMYEDDPQDKVFDVLGGAVFSGHPLGRAIIGHADVVAGTPADGLRTFHAERYVPENIVVAAAGSVDHDDLVARITRAQVERVGAPVPAPVAPPTPTPAVTRFLTKDTEQVHVCLGGPGIPRDDDRRYTLRVLDTILGGTSSSRLFQEVREKRGLAYSVYSYSSQYVDTGHVGVYVGTRPDNVTKAMEVIGDELRRIVEEPAAADELERAKENVKGRTALSLESTLTRMNRLGGSLLMGVPLLSLDEMVAAIDAVSADDVQSLARELFAPEQMSAAGVGGDETAFLRAIESVNPQLAATA